MDRQERIRRFRSAVNNKPGTGARSYETSDDVEPKKPQTVKRPTRIEEPDTDDDFDIWNFEAPEFTETIDVSPDGTRRATRRGRQGNASAVLTQTQYMYNDRDSARRMQQQMEAEEREHRALMQRMMQDYQLRRDQIKADRAATKRTVEAERERYRSELEMRRQEEKRRREAERRRAEEERIAREKAEKER